jgi:hypothetical protein
MAICISGAFTADDRYVRVLRWTFHRDSEMVICELGLTGDDTAYQLRVDPRWNPTGVNIEVFEDAMSAFQRHAMIERLLVDDGWTLESFESKKLERPRAPVTTSSSSAPAPPAWRPPSSRAG